MSSIIHITTPALVNVRVTSNLCDLTSEKRYDRGLTVGELKGRLELITGASSASMTIDVFDEKDRPVCALTDDEALFGSYTIEENYRLHVTDSTKKQGEFQDFSKVDKYELSDEAYEQRTDTVRSFLKQNKLGKYNPEEMAMLEAKKEAFEKLNREKASTLKIGERCEVRSPGDPTKRGVILYVGKTDFKPGYWVGVKLDEPEGKNDGSVDDRRYFEAPPKYGGFYRPASVTMGDFPEFANEEESDDEI